jgi:phosphoribosylaminoimidazolecarboxamide formyltransferase/IMP cyclohydrolase
LAGSKADKWFLRQHPDVLNLKFKAGVGRADRNNAIDQYLEDWLSPAETQLWAENFEVVPKFMTLEEKRAYLAAKTGVALGSDAFFPFRDNIDRAKASGVSYIAQPGGSVRDDIVIEACNSYGMVMAFTGTRLFHH